MAFLRKLIKNVKAGYRATAKIGSPALAAVIRKKHENKAIKQAVDPAAFSAAHKFGPMAYRRAVRSRSK